MNQIKKRLKKYRAKSVVVIFYNPENDWPRYSVLDVSKKQVCLSGEDNDHGVPHEGDSFWIDIDEIQFVWRVKE